MFGFPIKCGCDYIRMSLIISGLDGPQKALHNLWAPLVTAVFCTLWSSLQTFESKLLGMWVCVCVPAAHAAPLSALRFVVHLVLAHKGTLGK